MTEEVECEYMNERKIVVGGFIIGLLTLAAAFTLLFAHVDMSWWELRAAAINPVHTVIATAAMAVLGVAVYVGRNKRK